MRPSAAFPRCRGIKRTPSVLARLNCDILSGDLSPLDNYLPLVQLLHAGHPEIHRLTRPAGALGATAASRG